MEFCSLVLYISKEYLDAWTNIFNRTTRSVMIRINQLEIKARYLYIDCGVTAI
jgi:hypothetical protein